MEKMIGEFQLHNNTVRAYQSPEPHVATDWVKNVCAGELLDKIHNGRLQWFKMRVEMGRYSDNNFVVLVERTFRHQLFPTFMQGMENCPELIEMEEMAAEVELTLEQIASPKYNPIKEAPAKVDNEETTIQPAKDAEPMTATKVRESLDNTPKGLKGIL